VALKSNYQSFEQDWNKTVAWAQTQGINRNSWYPIYQMDSARLLAGENPMSTSERTRAILAAHNPNEVTPVASDKRDPTNIMGNTVTDLRNIFTGLSPNHLVANIFDTVKDTVIHPSTFIRPTEEVLGGALSGNTKELKSGLEQAAGLTGPGSILSWLPGVYVAGEVAQGGVGEVLSRPVSSFLDVAPFADTGEIIARAAGASRAASLAERLGFKSVDDLRQASIPGMAKQFAMTRKIGDLPEFSRKLTGPSLVEADGSVRTIGSMIDKWITAHTGMGKTLAALMKGMLEVNQHQTDKELGGFAPGATALNELKPEQFNQVMAIAHKTDPATKGMSEYEIANDSRIDPKVRTAVSLYNDSRNYVTDLALAGGHVIPRALPDGSVAMLHTVGKSKLIDASDEMQAAQDDLLAAMEPTHRLVTRSMQLDAQGNQILKQLNAAWVQSYKAAQELDGKQRWERVAVEGGKRPRVVAYDLRKESEFLFGKTEDPVTGTRDEGVVGQVVSAINDRDWAAAKAMSAVALRHLRKSGPDAIAADLHPAFGLLQGYMKAVNDWATKRLEYDTKFRAEFEKDGKFGKKGGPWDRYLKARKKFEKQAKLHPTAEWTDVVKDLFVKNLLDQEDKYHRLEVMATALRDRGWADEKVEALRHDPVKFAQLAYMEYRALGTMPYGDPILTPGEERALWKSALDQADKLRKSGHDVQWLPRVTSLDERDYEGGRYGVHVASTGKARRSRRAFSRKMDITAERHDPVAAVHIAAKEMLQIDGTIEYAERYLSPHIVAGDDMYRTILDGGSGLQDVFTEYLQQGTPADAMQRIMRDHFNMVSFDPKGLFGFTLPRWNPGETGLYIPKSIADALPKMLDRGQFPLDGAYDKVTNLFRFSILKMSPRYTAHVVFGGTFLLALRSTPNIVRAFPEAIKIMRDQGVVPRQLFDRTAPQFGIDPVEYRTVKAGTLRTSVPAHEYEPTQIDKNRAAMLGTPDDLRTSGNRAYLHKMGADSARWLAEENIEKVQGVKLAAATAMHHLKALGDINYKFTNWVSSFQRATAYVDYLAGAEKKLMRDPVTGESIPMTKDRAHAEAMHHVYKVMGDLQAMTPLERGVFTKVMPFYGWTKHILEYTLTYPSDHPFRASVLAVLANQDSSSVASGLPTRLQFLMFLGSPDAQGNVNAIDVRTFDPLRDVANYATLGGWISALNPVITAPLAMVDPSIIYGGNPLYPNVTYDQFYGIETAGAQGNAVTAVEQVVPQVQALQAALQTSGEFKRLAATNPNSFAKTIFNALNIPFAQVQHLNLKQIAAKDEMDRYHTALQASQNAFQSGDFSAIQGLASVPLPTNAEYEVTPTYLEQLYKTLAAQYPGLPPAEVAPTPPPPPL